MTKTRALMIQGCGSNVGKSLLVTALCRAYARRGVRVAPFKPQNMSNNAAVGARPSALGGGWGELARAQALQAQAAGIAPTTDMNPILLKPEADGGSAVVVSGRVVARMAARDWLARRHEWQGEVVQAFTRLTETYDLILVEGAGSPAEVNLRDGDLANMGFAEAVNVPVLLVGDIEAGGVIAQLAGTHLLLSDSERARVAGFLVNKFRGDSSLFDEGRAEIIHRTGWRDLGLLPWCAAARALPPEDSLTLDSYTPPDFALDFSGSDKPENLVRRERVRVVVPRLPSIANADDLDGLRYQDGVSLRVAPVERGVSEGADMILLGGSKSVRQDLAVLQQTGVGAEIKEFARSGGVVVGLCGGYQMLGMEIADPEGVEGEAGACAGLGLLSVATTLRPQKYTHLVRGVEAASGLAVEGYEIHTGETRFVNSVDSVNPARTSAPFLTLQRLQDATDSESPEDSLGDSFGDSFEDGAISENGRVFGSYMHGLFQNDKFRADFLNRLFPQAHLPEVSFQERLDSTLNQVADFIEAHCESDSILNLATPPTGLAP